MICMKKNLSYLLCCVLILTSCASQKNSTGKTISKLKFIGEASLPFKMYVDETTLGGLSGIDYNPAKDEYYQVCDDRSDINPLRFYTVKIFLSSKGIDSVKPIAATFFKKDGKTYHNRKQDSLNVPDPEALRFNPKTGVVYWSSEGERTVRKNKTILTNPAITMSSIDGDYIDTLVLPANMHMSATEKGPRNNGVFEGLAFSPDYKSLFVSVEEPLYDDGPRAGQGDSTGWTRIIKYDVISNLPVAQYAYKIDPIQLAPISAGQFAVNGVTDILFINAHQLLITERSYSTGRLGNQIRVYIGEMNGATDVSNISSLVNTSAFTPIQKKLLLNMDNLGILVDNIEGATFGQKLPNGKRSLIFASDNNFSATQKTQFLLFEVE